MQITKRTLFALLLQCACGSEADPTIESADSFEGAYTTASTTEALTKDTFSEAQDEQSQHPYPNDANEMFVVKSEQPGVVKMQVHFSKLQTQKGHDFVILSDESGTELARYSGTKSAFWTPVFRASAINVRLVSDASTARYGFKIDQATFFGCANDQECDMGGACEPQMCTSATCMNVCVMPPTDPCSDACNGKQKSPWWYSEVSALGKAAKATLLQCGLLKNIDYAGFGTMLPQGNLTFVVHVKKTGPLPTLQACINGYPLQVEYEMQVIPL